MFHDVDPLLFATGLVRFLTWTAIVVVAARRRRILPVAFGSLAMFTSLVFAIQNAHGHIDQDLADIATFVATPISFLVLGSVLVVRPTVRVSDRWSL